MFIQPALWCRKEPTKNKQKYWVLQSITEYGSFIPASSQSKVSPVIFLSRNFWKVHFPKAKTLISATTKYFRPICVCACIKDCLNAKQVQLQASLAKVGLRENGLECGGSVRRSNKQQNSCREKLWCLVINTCSSYNVSSKAALCFLLVAVIISFALHTT